MKKPQSNFYNKWLNDSFWHDKIPIENVNFIKLDYKSINSNEDVENINDFALLQRIIDVSSSRFDKPKKYVLFVTSDAIIGPNILSCFSLDLSNYLPAKSKISFDCFNSIHKNIDQNFPHYSFLYSVNRIHHENQFGGILLWRVINSESIEYSRNTSIEDDEKEIRIEEIRNKKISNHENIHKLSYKEDAFTRKRVNFEDIFGLFGYEFNKQLPPVLEDLFDSSTNNNYFYRTIRRLLYNQYESFKYKKTLEPKIPNLVHLIWFGDEYKSLKFIDYLCLKSIISILKPDKVKIHGDFQPSGYLWDEIKFHPKLEFVELERPIHRYNQDFTNAPIQHLADIARLEVLYEEGGLYTDFDVLWVKPIDELRFIDVEIIAANDLTSYCYEFPNNIQIGVVLAQPKSSFIREWLDRYEDYHLYPGDYTMISMCEPYKIYEKTPNRVLINNRLQMIYFNGWSMFIPRFVHSSKVYEYNENIDWLNNGSYAYHLPRFSSLHTQGEYNKANKSDVPIQIAKYILDLPFD